VLEDSPARTFHVGKLRAREYNVVSRVLI
jgi:hypothetical protein